MWKRSYIMYSKRERGEGKISGETDYALREYYFFQTIETSLISKMLFQFSI